MEVDNRMKAYLVLQGNLLIDESARLVNRNLEGEIKQVSIIKLFGLLFEHCKYEKSYYALLSFIPRSPLNSYNSFVKEFDGLKNKLGDLYTDDSPLVQCVTNISRIITLRKKLIEILPKIPKSIDYFEQVNIQQSEVYNSLFSRTTEYEQKRVEEIDDMQNICLVPLKRNVLNELELLRNLVQSSVFLQKREYKELGKLYESCTKILLDWKDLVLSELEGCNDLIPVAIKTFNEYPFFKMIRNWINALGDLANILGNFHVQSNYFHSIIEDYLKDGIMFMYFQKTEIIQPILCVPTQAYIVYGDLVLDYLTHHLSIEEKLFYKGPDHSFNDNNIAFYIYIKKEEVFVIVVQSNKSIEKDDSVFNFLDELMNDMFCFKSIFN
ncbi:hypothetical protein EDI_044690 [Entamoeba dispar SAW760]|uniref:Uncharacterized protein n=1 Tax=Entamoeba dispar (strain ATCC PRA-260 / SAW760) TaxID=370354 RepID=B0EHW9_ENTDS|nr:uncharacterized protein EDI_044690 [Entamoeba dispar SAW760]EDR25913.1 hypothetical protein EDI_044690 [Entamoeba dispar SAW760]|eukprot:EDR25913.1 hypothetical protein EDI_044690 [Entamoeba dispar SAW760]